VNWRETFGPVMADAGGGRHYALDPESEDAQLMTYRYAQARSTLARGLDGLLYVTGASRMPTATSP